MTPSTLLLFLLSLLSSTSAAAIRERRGLLKNLLGVSTTPATSVEWAALNATVGGKLYAGFPVARPCFLLASNGTNGATNLAQCAAVQLQYTNEFFIADNFGAYHQSNWGSCQATGAQCVLDSQLTVNPLAYTAQVCDQGSVSPYYIDVRGAADVQAGFAFSKKYGVPLVIKNSGHDYKGRSSAPGSLGLWTHNIQYTRLSQAFVPAGCPASNATMAVTFGAGNGFASLYQFAEDNNITIVGGSAATVGAAGGWLQGGGHSSLSNTLGLGVDRALEIKGVLANGNTFVASRCQNQDIFYAFRGGGGGTFGVVLEVTTTASPKVTVQVANIKTLSLDLAGIRKFMQIVIENSEQWAKDGWGGYIEPGAVTKLGSGLVMITPKLTLEEAKASMKPMTDYVASLLPAGQVALSNQVVTGNTFYQAYKQHIQPNDEFVGLGVAIASRFVPKANFQPGRQGELLDAFMKVILQTPGGVLSSPGVVYGGAPVQIFFTAPYNYPDDGTSAVHPGWRDAIWLALSYPSFNWAADKNEIKRIFNAASSAIDNLRAITPAGTYQNEADVLEPTPIDSFWGQANYNKLLNLKKQYDPDNLLACWHCVGWQPSDATTNSRYSCYPSKN